jgi:hypothetical protein
LQALAADPERCRRAGVAARTLAEERFARGDLATQFVDVLQGVAQKLS